MGKRRMERFEKGGYLAISTGEYSDYSVDGLFNILEDFDAQEQMNSWALETNRKVVNGRVERDRSKEIDYVSWLSKKGFIEEIEYREMHTNEYAATVLDESVKTKRG